MCQRLAALAPQKRRRLRPCGLRDNLLTNRWLNFGGASLLASMRAVVQWICLEIWWTRQSKVWLSKMLQSSQAQRQVPP
jgi:hypothetical protein